MAWTNPATWAANAVLTGAQLNTHLRDNLLYLKTIIGKGAAVELTINGGSVTVTQAYHKIDTAGDAATDDLDTIAGVNEGDIIILRAEDATHTVILRNGTGNLILGGDIYLDDVNKHVILVCDDASDLHLLHEAREVTFMANAFQYPAPGTDWTPQLEGAGLAADLAAKNVWLPLNFLKIGDEIISYKLVGDATEGNALTLDCKLVRVGLADPLDTDDIGGGGITQIDAGGNFDSEAVLAAIETVATDKQYVLELLGTTTGGDSIIVMGAEVLIRRLV